MEVINQQTSLLNFFFIHFFLLLDPARVGFPLLASSLFYFLILFRVLRSPVSRFLGTLHPKNSGNTFPKTLCQELRSFFLLQIVFLSFFLNSFHVLLKVKCYWVGKSSVFNKQLRVNDKKSVLGVLITLELIDLFYLIYLILLLLAS